MLGSINIQSSKLIRKRLEQNKLTILDLLRNSNYKGDPCDKVVVYDQSTTDLAAVPKEHFLHLVAKKLYEQFQAVFFLQGMVILRLHML